MPQIVWKISQKLWKFSTTILLHLIAIAMIIQSGECIDNQRPNIVIIIADDLGFDDVSFRGANQFLTPNIDALAFSGVLLNNLYTPAMCTPSRAALLTGKYPINTGMQHYVIVNDEPWSLPLNETTMAEIFQQHGYYTSLLGKWHLGMSRRVYTPTMRGFDKHFGYLGSYLDYYDHTLHSPHSNYSRGHDFRDNLKVTHQHDGVYVTDILTHSAVELIETHNATKQPLFLILSHLAPHSGNEDKPVQAPEQEINKYSYIKDITRRTYAAMVSELDKSVGQVIDALAKSQMLNNTIILFYSDNGGPTLGPHATTASNYPFRGQKNSPWEGGIRSSAAIWSSQFEKFGTVWKQPIYIADIMPTLAAAAGIQLPSDLKLDGLNLWSALRYGYESVEREIVHNIDEVFAYTSYMRGKWKYVNGTTEKGRYDEWLGIRYDDEIDPRADTYEAIVQNTTVWQHLSQFIGLHTPPDITTLRAEAAVMCRYETTGNSSMNENVTACDPFVSPCLFDIDVDPCEQNNIYEDYKNSKFLLEMLDRIEQYRVNAHPINNKPKDERCNPKYYHNEWTWWEDEQENHNSSANIYHIPLSYRCCIILLSIIYMLM